jgi:hypothetical protein
MYQLPGKTRVSDPCPHHQDQRGQNPGSERAGATAAAPTISEPGRTTEARAIAARYQVLARLRSLMCSERLNRNRWQPQLQPGTSPEPAPA